MDTAHTAGRAHTAAQTAVAPAKPSRRRRAVPGWVPIFCGVLLLVLVGGAQAIREWFGTPSARDGCPRWLRAQPTGVGIIGATGGIERARAALQRERQRKALHRALAAKMPAANSSSCCPLARALADGACAATSTADVARIERSRLALAARCSLSRCGAGKPPGPKLSRRPANSQVNSTGRSGIAAG